VGGTGVSDHEIANLEAEHTRFLQEIYDTIDPTDREWLSMYEWNRRLKAISEKIKERLPESGWHRVHRKP
jgi:hypothetical protein